MWIILLWILVGIITDILFIIEMKKDREDITLSQIAMIIAWLLIGPIMWLSIGMVTLTEFIENHKNDSIIKFKNNKFK